MWYKTKAIRAMVTGCKNWTALNDFDRKGKNEKTPVDSLTYNVKLIIERVMHKNNQCATE